MTQPFQEGPRPDERHDAPFKVYLLDDNPQVAPSLKRWFDRLKDFQWVGSQSTPDQIDEALARLSPDVLLVDWDMPGTDTAALLERLTAAFPKMNIAVLSAHLKPDYILAALAAGAAGYVYKGQTMDFLAADVHRLGEGQTVLSPEVRNALTKPDPA
jgi:DNA-binding NarL/FixJ family response regulator